MRRFLSLTAFLLTLTLLPVQAQEKTVILGGDTIAITVNYEGVYVSGMYDFEVKGETLSAAKEGTVQVGDRIVCESEDAAEGTKPGSCHRHP